MEARRFGIEPVSTLSERWPITIDGSEIRNLEIKYNDQILSEDWEKVVSTAAKILSQCPAPTLREGNATGLALGKVQSGKTLSYTTLVALSIDNGYRITIVLAGTKNPLLEQNYTRLCHDLGIPNANVTPFRNPNAHDSDVIRSVLHGGGHVLIVLLKHRMRIEEATRLVSGPELRDYPVLIIDDEGDEASLNTQFRRGRRTAIYNSIIGLRDSVPHHAYIAYTATPQANLLISGIDGLSPDFGVLVEPGQGYCGGRIFFGEDRHQYIRTVPIQEGEQQQITGVPDGLRRAIAYFLVAAAIRHLRDNSAWHSMLIHNSTLTRDHQAQKMAIQSLLELWREALSLPDSDPGIGDILELAREAYSDFCDTVEEPPTWEEVSRRLRDEIWIIETWMVNSLLIGRDPIGTPFRLRNNILIGGNMLGRGVTIPGLAVTYITRRAQRETNADTMEQRARWFGYKQDYLDVCRIFLTPQLAGDYTALLEHEDDFWDALIRNERQGLSIQEWPRMLRLDMDIGIRPTRPRVANYRRFRGNDWDVQNRLIEDHARAAGNIHVVRGFFQNKPVEIMRNGNVEHLILSDFETELAISELLNRVDVNDTDWEKTYINEYLARLVFGHVLDTVDIIFMAKGEFRERSKDQAGRINPMQGRSPNRTPTDPAFYPGDQNIHNDRVQLQVHMIHIRDVDVDTMAFALYVPSSDERYNLGFVVRNE
ncbi:Z1 domain-containing protein [Chloroflexota bacterium]